MSQGYILFILQLQRCAAYQVEKAVLCRGTTFIRDYRMRMYDFWFVFYLAAHGSGGITKIFIQRTDTRNEIAWYYCKC